MVTYEEIAQSAIINNLLEFWFNDREHIRSPFPKYIQSVVKTKTIERAAKWFSNLKDSDKDKITESDIVDKMESILFEEGLKAVRTEDEKITLLYPFLPRINDLVMGKSFADENLPKGEYTVVDRTLLKEGKQDFMKIVLKHNETGKQWETKVELP